MLLRRAFTVLFLACITVAGANPALAQGSKRKVTISIGQFRASAETTAWTAYGISLAAWVQKNNLTDTAPEGIYAPPYDGELAARQNQIQIWKELNEKELIRLPYMDKMLEVEAAGFLPEYVWRFHHRAEWGAPPGTLRLAAFDAWSVENLPGHTAQTGAYLNFSSPKSQ